MESNPANQPQPPPDNVAKPALSDRQEELVFRAASRRVVATVQSRTAEPIEAILADVARMPVYGAFVSLKRAGQLRSCCGYLGQSISLAEAVDHAAVRAAKDDPRFPPISPSELGHLDMEVWLLWAPEPVAAQGEDRAKAITIGKHGLQIARGAARGLLLPGVAVDHNLDSVGFLQQVCLKAGLPRDAWKCDDTTLMTFEGRAISGRLSPRESGPEVRPAAVAGTFYPARPDEIRRALDEMLPEKERPQPEPWPGAMVPHAGWVYSGRLAAAVFSRLKIPEQVIILCPKHRGGGADWAVALHRVWALPGCEVQSDPDLAQQLAEGITGLELDPTAHRQEHAIEVQLPLIARLAPHARVVGITIGGGELPGLLRFGQQMADLLRDSRPRPLLVISSDMNHFADDTETRRLDRLAIDAMESLDPARLYETVRHYRISMCGMFPAVIVMETLRQWDCLGRCELVGYCTSAESSGETDRVVGYAGMLFG